MIIFSAKKFLFQRSGLMKSSLLLLLGLIFIVTVQSLARLPNDKYASPDETANAFFTKEFIDHGRLAFTGPGQDWPAWAHPRSFAVKGNQLVPASFLGLPVYYGIIGKLFGSSTIPWLAGLIALGGIISFYNLQKVFFSTRIAQLSTLLLVVQPAYVFYISRPYWHNGSFVSLLVIAALLFSQAILKPSIVRYFGAGLGLGFALAFRTSEILWLAPILVAIGLIVKRTIKRIILPYFFIGLLVPIIPVAYFQYQTFHQTVLGAYGVLGDSTFSQPGNSVFSKILQFIIPWGLHPIQAVSKFWQFSIGMMFPTVGLGLLGALTFIKQKNLKKSLRWWYVVFLSTISLWLLLYYGSFSFTEYVFDPDANLLGSSYLRYWLPLYLFYIPLAVFFIFHISKKLPQKVEHGFQVMVFSIIILSSLSIVFADPNYGLVVTRNTIAKEYKTKFNAIMLAVPKNGIILAGPDDKIYWPERQAIGYSYGPMPDWLIRELSGLIKYPEVYFVTPLPGEATRINKRISDSGIGFDYIKSITGSYLLYRLAKMPENSL